MKNYYPPFSCATVKSVMESSLPYLHLEISNKCALACPACPRTIYKNEIIPGELPLAAIRELLNTSQRFDRVSLCGDHGDPIYHSQFHDVLQILKQLPGEPAIIISTNGSFRSQEWWLKTASILRKKDEVIFGVDGIHGISASHRVGSDWPSILMGLETLGQHGKCRIGWQWILFRFNEKNLAAAAQQARKLRINYFKLLRSSRYNETTLLPPQISILEAENIFRESYDSPAL